MDLIHFLQSHSNFYLTLIFRLFTFLGDEAFYLTIIPALYWTWKKSPIRHLIFLLLPTLLIAIVLKGIFQIPRPPGVALINVEGYAFPSGHALAAITVWGYLALMINKRTFTALSCIIILMISISRIYLGVHWPSDIIGGLLIGLALLILYVLIELPADRLLKRFSYFTQWLALMFVTILILAVFHTKESYIIMGLFLGMGTGIIMEKRYIDFSEHELLWKNIIKIIVGTAGTIALWLGLKASLPQALPFQFLRYALTGFWMMMGAPFIFIVLKLSSRQQSAKHDQLATRSS